MRTAARYIIPRMVTYPIAFVVGSALGAVGGVGLRLIAGVM